MEIIGQKQKISMPEYTEYLKDHGYSREQLTIDENSEIVNINSLEKGSVGTVIDIRCPCGHKIILAGRAQLPDKIHVLALRLADRDNVEIAPDTRIRIFKERPSSAITVIETMFYKDLTMTEYLKIPPNKTKPYDKFYRFNDSIEINGEDHLRIYVINPYITIDTKNIKLHLDIDFWEEE
jgi:hypothetical protein